MSYPIIRVENLSKKYTVNHQQEGYTTFRDAMTNAARSLGQALFNRKNYKPRRSNDEEFWALKDVNFEIQQGDRVGIIGRNGAGKSTLLKVLSRITEPTHGSIRIKGRVASLLEVGTGFHPELTGRENIYLNGAILGMSKAEIKRKFDEIIDFAEIEKFLDTPVKRYSSGMYVRLAFAVAAHLEPEILIVDEVLAVGDVQFQKKCLGKMQDVSKDGRTVLFVSHNMSAIESLCNRGILLDTGTVGLNDTSERAVSLYLDKAYRTSQGTPLLDRKDRKGNGNMRISGFRVLDETGREEQAMQSGKDFFFEITYLNKTERPIQRVIISIDFYDEHNHRVLMLKNQFTNDYLTLISERDRILCKIENLPLANGSYRIALFAASGEHEILDWIEDAATVNVDGGDFFATGSQGLPTHCKILTKAQWTVSRFPDSTVLADESSIFPTFTVQ